MLSIENLFLKFSNNLQNNENGHQRLFFTCPKDYH